MIRKIVKIDEEKCDGCGLCVPSCHEGALQIINGKAKVVNDSLCDGLGDCLGDCPQGAITIEERNADAFDEEAVKQHLATMSTASDQPPVQDELPCGCPGAAMRSFDKKAAPAQEITCESTPSSLTSWPVQLMLVPPGAPFLKNADLLISADCVPFAYPDFHGSFLEGRTVLIGCPKLDDLGHYRTKLEAIFREAQPRSVTVLRMEVPCCIGIAQAATEALQASGVDAPLDLKIIGIQGDVREEIFPGLQTRVTSAR